MSNWIYKDNEYKDNLNDEYYGFIYIITNLNNNKKYIGRKTLTQASYKKIKGKKTLTRKESNWKNYYGSCKELKEDIKKYGVKNFKREIICFCNSQAELNYFEAKYQFINEVLESDKWYNSNIYIRAFKRNILKIKT